jgi:P4 family phage/plasmid primase-like protien
VPWLAFLEGLFRDDQDRHEKIAAIQEHAGACLLGVATTYDRALVFEGEANNGKSSLLEILAPAMPPGSTSAIPPQDWDQEYRRAMLAGKLLNFVSELPESEIIASESFKAIVAGDQTVGRYIRQAPFNFHPVAGHIFAANRLPSTADQTTGFWRRFLVVAFRRNFTDDPERDPHIAERLVAERPRVVSWMLEGALRLLRQKDYTIPPSHLTALERWRRTSDQVTAWIEERVSRALPGFGTMATPAYRAFADWAKDNGHRPPSSTKWAMRMTALGYPAVHTRHGNVYPIRIAGHDSAHVQREGV